MGEATMLRGRHEVRKTNTAAVASGEVHQLPDGRAGVRTGLDASVAGETNNFVTEGQHTVTKTTGVVILDGGPVYWDHSANAATFRRNNDRDFYLGAAVGDAASGDTTLVVNINVRPVYEIDIARDPFTSVIVLTAGTPTLERFGGKHKLSFSATNEAQKIDILSDDSFAVGANAIVEFAVTVRDNGDSGEGDFNIGVANGTSATDMDAVTESCLIHIDTNSLNILAESDDGSVEVNATDTTIDYAEGTRFEGWLDLRDPSDIQVYINGVNVLPLSVFRLDSATGPLKLIAHLEKSGNDTPGVFDVDSLRVRTAEQ